MVIGDVAIPFTAVNFISTWLLLLMGFKLMAGAVASCALIGVAVGVGIIYGSLLISIGRNPSQRDELLRYAFIGFSLVEVSGLIGLVISLLLLFGFDGFLYHLVHIYPVTHKLLVTELLLLLLENRVLWCG